MTRLRRIGLVAIVCGALAAGAVHAACGDGALDDDELCDHGAANGADGCCTADCLLLDADFDALCDAADGCDIHALDARIKEPRLELQPSADGGVLRLRGRITLPASAPVDPAAQGLRITLNDSPAEGYTEGARVLDALVPPGPRWSRRADAWTYRDRDGTAGGILRVGLKRRPPIVPTTNLADWTFVAEGRLSAGAVTPAMVTMGFDRATGRFTGRALVVQVAFVEPARAANPYCGGVFVSSDLGTRCTFALGGVVCQGPPVGGPCRIGDPDDLVVCDVVNTVRAQARWFARHPDYFTGVCATMPGVVASPGVVCSTAGTATGFAVSAAHPVTVRTCYWTSAPGVAIPLVCS